MSPTQMNSVDLLEFGPGSSANTSMAAFLSSHAMPTAAKLTAPKRKGTPDIEVSGFEKGGHSQKAGQTPRHLAHIIHIGSLN